MSFQQSIRAVELPERVVELAAEYDRRIGIRDDFVWRWMYSLLPEFRLSCVSEPHHPAVREQKTILTLFITTLDDTAEHNRDTATFEQVRAIPFPHRPVDSDSSGVDQSVVDFARNVWRAFERPLRDAPRYDEFVDLLRFDVRQTINAMRYSQLVSEQPAMANLTDAYRFGAHNMVMFPYADVDLMYSPAFDRSDLASLRETLWKVQRLARIGNWITTWERELEEGDYSSGIVVAALQEGLIDPSDLCDQPSDLELERYFTRLQDHEIESQFLYEWRERFADLRNRSLPADSVNLDALIRGMETILEYHQNSRGLK